MICPECGCEYTGNVCPYCQSLPNQAHLPLSNFPQESKSSKEKTSDDTIQFQSRIKWFKDVEVFAAISIVLGMIFYLFGYLILSEVFGILGLLIFVISEIVKFRMRKKQEEFTRIEQSFYIGSKGTPR